MSFWAARIRAFYYAFAGLAYFFRTQRNAWIHALATILVTGAGAWVGLTKNEWLWIATVVAGVWITETFNTAIECLSDAAVPHQNVMVGHAKDVAAGAVLLAAALAVVIGAIVFWPHVMK